MKKVATKTNRIFEVIPETVVPAFGYFSLFSAIAVPIHEQLKTVEMYISVMYIVRFI